MAGVAEKKCSRCKIIKPASEFHVCRSKKSGLQSACKACGVKTQSEWRASNLEHCRERDRAEYAANPQAAAARNARWRAKNPDYHRDWEAARPGDSVARTRRWQQRNPDKVSAACASYRASVAAQAIPLSEEQKGEILAIYAEARRLSEATGIPHHVDHIVPLNGESVCGLHVPWNLRAIPAVENIAKSNKLLECV